MKKGESVCCYCAPNNEHCDKVKNEDEDKDELLLDLLQKLKEIPCEQQRGKRNSSGSIFGTDGIVLMSQENASALESADIATVGYLPDGRSQHQQPKSIKKQRRTSTENSIHCASTERATNRSKNHSKGTHMPTQLLLQQSDPYGSGILQQTRQKMNSPPPPPAKLQPTENDVIYGRGVANARTHLFRQQVFNRRDAYIHGDAVTQVRIVNELIELVHNCGGQFLARDSGSSWVEMDKSAVNVRIRQSLRDCHRNTNIHRKSDADTQTPPVLQSTAEDVIYGRGAAANKGTESFRAAVRSRRDDYVLGNAATKRRIVHQLIELVRNRGGRFLMMVSGSLFELKESDVNEKIRQSLRDGKPSENKYTNYIIARCYT